MTVKEYEKRNLALEKAIATKIMNVVADYANQTLIQQITSRIIKTQTDANVNKFSRYSDKPCLSSGETVKGKHVWRELASSKTKRRKLDWVTVNGHHLFEVPGGYAQIRKISGEKNTYKNFFWTGEMWKKTGLISKKLINNGFKIRIAGRTPTAQDKLDWNSEREGVDLLGVMKREEKQLGEYIDKWLVDEIRKAGLQ